MPVYDGAFTWPSAADTEVQDPQVPSPGFEASTSVMLSDGRVLVVWSEGNDIYEAYAPNVNTVVTTDDWIGDPEHPVSQGKSLVLPGYIRPSLTEIDGEIYMTVLNAPSPLNMMGVWVYRRVSQGSWIRHGTVYEVTFEGSDFGFIGNSFFVSGVITVFNGLWVLPTPFMFRTGIGGTTFHDWNAAIYTSSDAGVTWTQRFVQGFGNGLLFRHARELGVFNSTLYFAQNFNVSGNYVATSTDGIAWTNNYVGPRAGPNGAEDVEFPLSDDNYIYIATNNPLASPETGLYRTTNPLDKDEWELVEDYDSLNVVLTQTVLSPAGSRYYLWWLLNGTVFGVPVGGCLPYASATARSSGGRVRVLTDMVRMSRLLVGGAVTQPRSKCAPCEAANARSGLGHVRTRLKKAF